MATMEKERQGVRLTQRRLVTGEVRVKSRFNERLGTSVRIMVSARWQRGVGEPAVHYSLDLNPKELLMAVKAMLAMSTAKSFDRPDDVVKFADQLKKAVQ